ncbi:cytoplasmic phosphatidylinositol transfer protein 1 [Macrosteles quadrilineatus]|uniref:cytoplasmic phosphatidylinositol transfer protein 1 n=1 Tax=Macrosteles quadrilineatus TaxID=74068 RepID=UPI0023E2E4F4|nr:cytoplasmic phosphatidylinositol transfer protein 1 [Macrosteles quadrilineatus]
MVLLKEYRICMPLSVEEYQIGQLYMIARHSHEQSESGEGVEVVVNVPCEHPEHGKGQYTEKRIHLSSKLPYWIQSFIPRVFYVTEKAWNYYPYTITEYTCSFLPKFSINIQTKFENNNGTNDNCLNLTQEQSQQRMVDFIDICYDEVSPKHYKEEEDLKFFQSKKTKRGPLVEGWRENTKPIMCSYKVVQANFEVWGLQTKAEELIQRSIREILLLGHRQAFAWVDEWYDMTLADVRIYESEMHRQTNVKVTEDLPSVPTTPKTPPKSPKSPTQTTSSWLSWS